MIPVVINVVSSWLIYLKRWLCNRSKKRKLLIFLGAAFVLVFIYWKFQLKFLHWYLERRINIYCNTPGPIASSEEGTLHRFSSSQYRLRHVQMVVRHGDRAPLIPNLPNMEFTPHDCSFRTANKYQQKMLKNYLEIAPNFIVRRPHHANNVASKSVIPFLGECKLMQLTGKGFLQHIYLGRHFKKVYGEFMGPIHSEDEFYVHSTNRDRTLQSAAAFLTGFLTYSHILTGRVAINTSTDGWFREGLDGRMPKCLGLNKLWNKVKQGADYRQGLDKIEVLMRKFGYLFQTPREKSPSIVYITDSLLTSHCHNHKLPCGPHGCVTPSLVQEAILSSDWAYVHNFTSVAKILIHPLLQKITQNILDRITHHSPQKMALYFGHETTVLPLLMVFGGFDGHWPRYAARVVIELWHDDFSSDGGMEERGENEDTDTDIDHYYFRVLFNGQSLVENMKLCRKVTRPEKLCPVRDLVEFMRQGSLTMDMRYRELCKDTS